MKITKIIAIACATFALVACGGEADEKAWEKTDADAYVTACTTADKTADAKARCTCQAAEMGKTVRSIIAVTSIENASITNIINPKNKRLNTSMISGVINSKYQLRLLN